MTKILVVVDMLNDFVDEKGLLFCGPTARGIIPFIKSRLDEYRKNEDIIIFLQDAHDEDDLEFNRFPKHAIAETWGSDVVPELSPFEDDMVIEKKRYSGFYETILDAILPATNSNEVEVVGVCTSICVMDTVGGFANRDFKIKVPAAGVADFDAEMHAFALKRMSTLYGADIT